MTTIADLEPPVINALEEVNSIDVDTTGITCGKYGSGGIPAGEPIDTTACANEPPCEGGIPDITSTAPSSITAGGPTFDLTLNGVNFRADAQVTVNGEYRTVTFVSSTELQVEILNTDIASAGTLAIVVINPPPGCGPSTPFDVPVALSALPIARFTIGGQTTFDWQSGEDPPQVDANAAFLFEDMYTNAVYVVDTGLAAYNGDVDHRLWVCGGVGATFTNGQLIAMALTNSVTGDVKIQTWQIGYTPTIASDAADSGNGPSFFVTATKISEFDYPVGRLSSTVAFPAFKNVLITAATATLQSGGKPACNATMAVTAATISAGGTGYTAGDNCAIYGRDATFHVDTVNGSGVVLTGHVTVGGTNYVTSQNVSCTGGTGTGLILSITSAWDELYNFGTNLTTCDCTQHIARSIIDIQFDKDDPTIVYALELDNRTATMDSDHNWIATACVANHGQFTFSDFQQGEVSELTWDQCNLVKIQGATLTQLDEWLMRYRVTGNSGASEVEPGVTRPARTSRIQIDSVAIHTTGSGYHAGDDVTVNGGLVPATVTINTVDGSGHPLTIAIATIIRAGWGYTPNSGSFSSVNVATTGGHGTGFTVDFNIGGPLGLGYFQAINYRDLLGCPRIWDGAAGQIIGIANQSLDYDKFITDPLRVSSATTDGMGSIKVNTAGSGYKQDELVSVTGIGGGGAVRIVEVDGSGAVLYATVNFWGTGATISSGVTTSGGSGTGFKIDILALYIDTNGGQLTWNGGMAVLESPGAITTLNYKDASDSAKTYMDYIPMMMWPTDRGLAGVIANPDTANLGVRAYQPAPTFVAHDPVASQPLDSNGQTALIPPTTQVWQGLGSQESTCQTTAHRTFPYNQTDSGGSITATKVMVDGTVTAVTDSNPSDHALQTLPVCNVLILSTSKRAVSDWSVGDFESGYRLLTANSPVTISSTLEVVSPAGELSDTSITIARFGFPMYGAFLLP